MGSIAPGADLGTLDAALKETWTESRLAEQLYQKNPLLDRVKKLKSTQVGQQAVTPIHTGRNGGYTPLPAAGGTLNTAGNQQLSQAIWQYTHHHQQVAIQGSAIDGTRGDALSVAEVVDLEVDGALTDLNRQLTRQLFSDGDALAVKTGVTASGTTINLAPVSGFNAIERGWLSPGAQIVVGTAGSEGSLASNHVVISVNESTTTPSFTLGTAAAPTTPVAIVTAGTDATPVNYVSFKGSRVGATSYEMNGLGNLISQAGTVGGVAASGVWSSNVDSTAQALTLPLMYGRCRVVFQKTGSDPNYVLTSPKQLEKAYSLAQAQVRFASDSVSFGSVEGTSIMGMKMFRQPDCKNEDMFFLTVEDLLLVSAGDPFWQNKITGGNILTWIQGSDSYGAKISTRLNLGLRRRNSHSALRGLT